MSERANKELVVAEILEQINNSQGIVIVDYRGLNVKELTQYLRCSDSTVRKLIKNKEIPKDNINIASIKDKNTNQKQPQIIHVGNNKNEIEKIKEDNYQKPCPYNLRPTKNINYQESDEEDLPKSGKLNF